MSKPPLLTYGAVLDAPSHLASREISNENIASRLRLIDGALLIENQQFCVWYCALPGLAGFFRAAIRQEL